MKYRNIPRKATVFKVIYFVFSLMLCAYTAYLLIEHIVYGFKDGVNFDDCVILIATLFALLFEGSLTGFAVRSFKNPTILMKNLVFKNDGTPYLPGLLAVAIGAVLACAASVVCFISAYFNALVDLPVRAQTFIFDICLIVFVNLSFTTAYFVTFRHESGSFAII